MMWYNKSKALKALPVRLSDKPEGNLAGNRHRQTPQHRYNPKPRKVIIMNFELTYEGFNFQIRIQKQEATEKGKHDIWRMQVSNGNIVVSRAYESKYMAMNGIDNQLAKFLRDEENLTKRVILANIRECLQALHTQELTNAN